MTEKKGFFDLFIQDILTYVARPETHDFLEKHIIRPLLERVIRSLYPYLVGVLVLWILMFACLAVILLLIMRGK
jgi:hypothetical protein